jgi:hypothetical protein
MITRKFLLACSVLLLSATSALAQRSCKEPELGTKDRPVFSPPLAEIVTGAGRLQFYSAPDVRCRMDGVFVIPRDELVAYGETDSGWSSVMYTNPKTGNSVLGWVRSERLKQTGTAGPRQ